MKIFSSIGKWFVRQWHNEPLRSTTYTISAAVLTYLLATGVVTQSLESLILTVIGVVLVGGGTEAARTQVAPMTKLAEDVTAKVAAAIVANPGITAAQPAPGATPAQNPLKTIVGLIAGFLPKA